MVGLRGKYKNGILRRKNENNDIKNMCLNQNTVLHLGFSCYNVRVNSIMRKGESKC